MAVSATTENQGFTLVELLISMALSLMVAGTLSTYFISQRKAYDRQEQLAEMTQNARAAMVIMSRDAMMTGYGVPRSDLSTWIDWAGVTFGTQPFVIEDGAGAEGTDILHIAGCFDGPAATLSSDASIGDTQIVLTPVHGTVSQSFDTSDEKVIAINGLESAVVTGVSGNTLTIDTDPDTSGNQGLNNAYAASATTVEICVVKVVSYSIVQDPDGSLTLKRDEHLGAGRQPLAENMVDLQISPVTDATTGNISLELNPLTAQTGRRDPGYGENDGYRRRSFRFYVTPPNLAF